MSNQAKKFFIFIGRSGCGKGTQVDLLKSKLEKDLSAQAGGHKKVLHITTGSGFRDFIESDSYAANISKKINDEGGLQPEFLAVWNWANIFIKTLTGEETVILDGAPRRVFEVGVLHSAISFFGYEKPTIIYLDVKESTAIERLLGRGRDDDNEANIDLRMKWFETDVLDSIAEYMIDPRYNVLHINGEKSEQEIHEEIIKKLEALDLSK